MFTVSDSGCVTCSRIDLIKMVRSITGNGLKESKDAVDDFLLMEEQREVYLAALALGDRIREASASKMRLTESVIRMLKRWRDHYMFH